VSMFPTDPFGRPPPSAAYPPPMDTIDRHRPPPGMDRPTSEPYARRPSPDRREREPPSSSMLSDTEFEEILQRNKTVSSSAISRAVQDASSGDFGSAIETLVTAVSLIKQSKIANDDRCKILISSLQDTLHGIELKSYGSKSMSRSDRRSRSPRERDPERSSRSRQQRSRSREYHDDRHLYREVIPHERSRERSRSREPVILRERSRERSRERDPYERSSRLEQSERGRGTTDSRRYESERHRAAEYATSSRSSRH
jgi:cleavage and polyadenylation specificity factor subunit 6/7